MPNIKIVRLLIVLALCVMMAAAVKVRSEAILQTKYKSIDEMVYHRLAVQIQWGLENYHTIPLAHKLSDAGRDLPDYFFEPLFKHPPLFTFFNYAVYQTFGITPLSPFYVTLACGVLMIPLVYLFGAYVFNLWVGFFSALVMALDPVTIICSQNHLVPHDHASAFIQHISSLKELPCRRFHICPRLPLIGRTEYRPSDKQCKIWGWVDNSAQNRCRTGL